MSDLTLRVGTNLLGHRAINPKANREVIPLDSSEKSRRWSLSCVFELRFSAAC